MTDKTEPDRSDIPAIQPDEEPDTPTIKSYMLSREVRGWAVGMAAVVVALAAVAPTLDLPDLRGAALVPRDAVPNVKNVNVDDVTCTAQDQTGGVGGQTVKCAFVCPDGPGTVSVSVDADDNDAQVSGIASCGDGNAQCSGKDSCSGTDTRRSGGAGACSGDSDEAVDSGLYVECSSSADNLPGPHGPGEEWCPVTEPQQVCIQPACYQLSSTLQAKCQSVWAKMAETVTTDTIKLGPLSTTTGGAGLLCKGFVCTPFEVSAAA